MTYRLKILIIIVSASFGLVACSTSKGNNNIQNTNAPSIIENTASGTSSLDPAKKPSNDLGLNFTLNDLSGQSVSLSQFRSKKVFVNFWATWCGYCINEMPDIQSIQQENNPDLVILALNVGENSDTAKNFITSKKYTFSVLLDQNESVSKQFKVSGYPTSFFIDRNGKINSKVVGNISKDVMKQRINAIP